MQWEMGACFFIAQRLPDSTGRLIPGVTKAVTHAAATVSRAMLGGRAFQLCH